MVKNVKSSFLGDTKEYQWPSTRGLSFIRLLRKQVKKMCSFTALLNLIYNPAAKSITKKWSMMPLNEVSKKGLSLMKT